MLPHLPGCVVVIAGPTGVGKSDFALELAERIGGEIVNCDSVQIYRGFDLGSAKPSAQARDRVPHHLFDIVDANQEFDAAAFAQRARSTCLEIFGRGSSPILVGGTGFYLRAFLTGLPEMPGRNPAIRQRIRAIAGRPHGLERLHRRLMKVDPVSGAKIAPADRHRIERALEVYLETRRPISSWTPPAADPERETPSVKFAFRMERSELNRLLDERVNRMYAAGLVDETRRLLLRYPPSSRPFSAIGYREAVRLLAGEIGEPKAIEETRRRTRAYAKRQMTWLRGEQNVRWLDVSNGLEQNLAAALRVVAHEIKRNW